MPKYLDFQRTQLDTVAAQGCVLICRYLLGDQGKQNQCFSEAK